MHARKPAITVLAAAYTLAIVTAALTPAYRMETIAGSTEAGDGSPAVQGLLHQADGVVFDARTKALFISDAADHRVRRVSAEGTISTYAGDGTPGYFGDNNSAIHAKLRSPYGLALDAKGNLFIADLGNHVIRRVSPEGIITTWAGGGKIPAEEQSEGSHATHVAFHSPRDLALDPDGTLYISDFGAHRIYAVSADGTLRMHAGNGKPGYGANDIPAIRSSLRNPAGLWIDPHTGALLVAEAGAHRIRRILRGVISAYPFPPLSMPLYSPTGVAVDAAGTLYVADNRQGAALKRNSQGEISMLPAGGKAVTLDPQGNAYYANGTVVYKVDRSEKAVVIAGGTAGGLPGDNGQATGARLAGPSGVAFDNAGNLFVADERHHRIRRITPDGTITTIAGTGIAGFSGDQGDAKAARLHGPRGISVEATGDLLIADTGNHVIRRVTTKGQITTVAGSNFQGFGGDGGPASLAMLDSPEGVLTSPDRGFYIADTGNHRLRRVSAGGVINAWAGSGSGPGFSGDGNIAAFARLSRPSALALTRSGDLYFTDSGNGRVRRIDGYGIVTSVAESLGQTLRGLAVDGQDRVCVSDFDHHRIGCLDGSRLVNLAGDGTAGFSGDGGAALEARVHFPAGLAFDSYGAMVVADWGNNRVRRLIPMGDTIIAPPTLHSRSFRLVHAATHTDTALAPGLLVTLYGQDLAPAGQHTGQAHDGILPTRLADVEVTVNGTPAPLLYVSPTQINFQVPYRAGTTGAVRVEVRHHGSPHISELAPQLEAVPGLFTSGNGPGLIAVHGNGSLNSETNPAPRGDIVVLYATGAGRLTPEVLDGHTLSGAPLSTPSLPVRVWIGSMEGDVRWAGAAPGYPGLLQLNVRVPAGFFASGAHIVRLQIGSFRSTTEPLLYIR